MAKKKKKRIDWEKIEGLYRAGQLSVREIARQNKCSDQGINRKAKVMGWQRDLSDKIRRKVRIELDREQIRSSHVSPTDEEVVDAAVSIGVEIEQLQREDIKILRELEAKFIEELTNDPQKTYTAQFQGMIVSEEFDLAVTEKAAALSNLTNVMQKRVDLERRAYNLDDTSSENQEDWIHVNVHPVIADMLKNPDSHTEESDE